MENLFWQPFFAPLPLLTGAGFLVALAVLVFRRTSRDRPVVSATTLVMRLLLITAVTILLMGPSTAPPESKKLGRPSLTIMLDTSASMRTVDVGGQSRYDFATKRWLNRENLERLRFRYDVALVRFDEKYRVIQGEFLSQPASTVATGGVSNIIHSVREVLSFFEGDEKAASVLLISDGHDTSDASFQSVAKLARAKSIPIHTLALGGSSGARDITLAAIPMQEYLLAGEEGQIAVRVLQRGCDHLSTTLQMSS